METTKTSLSSVKKSPTPQEKPSVYKVIDPVTDPSIPSFPSTVPTACKNLETYLQKFEDQGFSFAGIIPQNVGRDVRNLFVFRKK